MTPAELPQDEVEAARQLRRLLDCLPALVSFWNPDLRCALANRAYRDWFGLSEQQIQGMHMREVLGSERFAEILPFVEMALRGDEQFVERTVMDPDGRLRRSSGRYIPYRDNGKIQGFFTVVEDHTTESEMRQQLDNAQSLARIGSYVYYPVSGEVSWSAEMFRLIEADEETDVPSLSLWESRIHPDDMEEARATLDDSFAQGRPFALHTRLLLPSGQVRYVQCLGEPTRDDRGTFVRMSGTVQDETDIRLMNDEMRRSNDQLENANQLLSDMLATLSHDVRQPVQSAMGFLEFTLDEWNALPEEQRRDNLERAFRAGSRIVTLFDNILALMNLESGKLVARSVDVPVEEELSRTIREVAPEARLTSSVDEPITVHADAFQLNLIVTNLLANANRYGEPPVEVSATRSGDTAEIVVSDCGEGVPEDFVPRLFDRFSRASSGVAASRDGNGFGLYLARQLARANGGDLTYRPREPHGSSFVLTVPLARTPAGD